ncbi:multicopper oxidase [Zasmidium cellare ATCC 36951]|uniref:laccase n=1 Tax=Zasmidium cellare ATCC 36951 TaxID=1080233 RepID=A0A6A6CTM3_ZASCE|nr:multicopper oxidase [Zasmidium cellare ATCC 36951]KAF2170607.1 multicopper oxidase [Zasmidium cellare ATCC 36951]
MSITAWRALLTVQFFLTLATNAVPTPVSHALNTTSSSTQTPTCAHSSLNRGCWDNGFSINDDFDQYHPATGKTVEYSLEITNSTCNPDDHGARICMLVNGQYPGPTLRAAWGDQMIVHVKNSMQDNGTTIHFHGVRQLDTNAADGVPGVAECPIAPGKERTYVFNVTQFGTGWYHSHFSAQYGDGVAGPIVFDGPATANYDIDLGPYPVNEWYYRTAWQASSLAIQAIQTIGKPPAANNMLVNGTNESANGTGTYNQVTIEQGNRYRLRIISMSVDNYMHVSLDGHRMEIIAADFVPIKPIFVEWIFLGAGQRYDVIITANQQPASYWFRTEVAKECRNNNDWHGRAIWSYSGLPTRTPNSTAFPEPTDCLEPTPLTPYWPQTVPPKQQLGTLQVNTTHAVTDYSNNDSMVVWALGQTIDVNWSEPTLSYIHSNTTQALPSLYNVLPTAPSGAWNYWLIQQPPNTTISAIPHPIHLHGHDFFVLGQGNTTWEGNMTKLNFESPTRRDTSTIYGNGYLAIAYRSDNPGAWLMHCHIAWHINEGFGVQFLEAPEEIKGLDGRGFGEECEAWSDYYEGADWRKMDSGL